MGDGLFEARADAGELEVAALFELAVGEIGTLPAVGGVAEDVVEVAGQAARFQGVVA